MKAKLDFSKLGIMLTLQELGISMFGVVRIDFKDSCLGFEVLDHNSCNHRAEDHVENKHSIQFKQKRIVF